MTAVEFNCSLSLPVLPRFLPFDAYIFRAESRQEPDDKTLVCTIVVFLGGFHFSFQSFRSSYRIHCFPYTVF